MNLNFRIAHWGVIFSFPTLVLTGFALSIPTHGLRIHYCSSKDTSHFAAWSIAPRRLCSSLPPFTT
jgi:cytochrome b subunit of formate dehydrogenase